MGQRVSGVLGGRVAVGGPAEPIGGFERFTTEFDRAIRCETGGLDVLDIIKADLRQHRFGVSATGDRFSVDDQFKRKCAIVLCDVLEVNPTVQKVGQARRRLGGKIEFRAFVPQAKETLISGSLTAEKRIVRPIVIIIVGRAEKGCQSKIDHGNEHALFVSTYPYRAIFAVNVLDVIHIMGMVARNKVTDGLMGLWVDMTGVERVAA